jgi:hypothetical protein
MPTKTLKLASATTQMKLASSAPSKDPTLSASFSITTQFVSPENVSRETLFPKKFRLKTKS